MVSVDALSMKMRRPLSPTLPLLLVLLLVCSVGVCHSQATQHRQEDEEVNPKEEWYTRYPHYPSYCSTPEQMQHRSIPLLKPDTPPAQLRHVTAIVRHGARTIPEGPSDNNYHCWEGYWTNPETGVWNCPLKTLYMPPSPDRVLEQEKANAQIYQEFPHTMFLFTKDYDALQSPLSNVLNGTCQLGQLMLQGYDQQVKNGQIIRDAYLWEEGSTTTSTTSNNLRLFQVGGDTSKEPWADKSQLYLRSDDSQATLMSVQLLMRGLFQKELIRSRAQNNNNNNNKGKSSADAKVFPTIPVHTTDHARDILGGFREHCEALTRLQYASDTSYDYQTFIESDQVQDVQAFLAKNLYLESSILDCLMTTVCTDRPLPDPLGIYNPHPKSWFNRITNFYTMNHSFHINYNDAEYSKLSMGPLWAEIMDHIDPVLQKDSMDTANRPRTPAKLAIYSGYDTTIMEILASLGAWSAQEWPPYASMILLEIYELTDETRDSSTFSTNYAFRLLYNGIILTDRVMGCTYGKELCDAQRLVDRVKPFARRNVDCIDVNLEKPTLHPLQIAKALITTTGGIILILLILAVSALVGSIGVFYHLTGSVPTEELKTIQRQVFPNTRKQIHRSEGFDVNRSTLVSEHEEMNMANASALDDDDDFEDEPSDK